jgi:ParB-like chromosome segregation protein Spo0J
MSNNQLANTAAATGVQRKQVLMQHVKCDDLRFQVRQQLNQAKVDEYAQQITPGTQLSAFPRPLLWKPKGVGGYVICDGWHRLSAAQKAGVTVFDADVLTCSEQEAEIAAMAANMSHGIPLTSAEREEAIFRTFKALTKDGVRPSDADVHERLRIPESSVCACRKRLEQSGRLAPAEKVLGKDGKTQAAKKKANERISATPPPVAPPTKQEGSNKEALRKHACTTCKPKKPDSGANSGGPAEAPGSIKPVPDSEVQEEEILQVLDTAERVLNRLANEGWAGIHLPGSVASRIESVIKAGQEALKAKGGTASVAA